MKSHLLSKKAWYDVPKDQIPHKSRALKVEISNESHFCKKVNIKIIFPFLEITAKGHAKTIMACHALVSMEISQGKTVIYPNILMVECICTDQTNKKC